MLTLNFFPFPQLTTGRLVLRRLEAADENEIFAIRSDDRVNEFLERTKASSVEDARKFIHQINSGIDNNEGMYWGIHLKDDNKIIGTICFWNISAENCTAEIGYELHPDFQGKGYMQEAIEMVIQYGFEDMKLVLILAELDAANVKSIQLLERNNFKKSKNEANMIVYSLPAKR
jgi:ribosomal-protein-alanine N-acetyltransferase